MSVIWPLGDAIPPTAIIGRLTTSTVGMKEPYGKFLRYCLVPADPHRDRRDAHGRLQQEARLPDGVLRWRLIVTILYYLMTAFIAVLLVRNFLKRKNWQEEALYIIVLIPFLLRLLRLK